ncbi:hypothetical protein PILCRDRAFT_745615 [Piloderma croceum F 1598]|uniref:Uncharacterized protein n=1 Tax=Piloderma croceum (strain F 1598) TaxID=765440 RepID=A0A0C3EW06_PILCF|nr:hypothetical protein PILCRDRAFT_745615 [Piloderma croceum F 1598]
MYLLTSWWANRHPTHRHLRSYLRFLPPIHRNLRCTHDLFLLRNKDKDKEKLPSSNVNGIMSPLPPRKPPFLIPPLHHASLITPPILAPIPSSSVMTLSPSTNVGQMIPTHLVSSTYTMGGAVLPGYATSPLMDQSLQVSKATQTTKNAVRRYRTI